MIHIAICDDDEIICEQICRLIEQQSTAHKIETFNSGSELLVKQNDFQLIFLDIQMPGINGIETARKIREAGDQAYSPIIVMITALDSHMQDAFDVEAFHYILKPIDEPRFIRIFNRAVAQILVRSRDSFLLIKSKGVSKKLLFKDISYIDCYQKKAYIHTEKETHMAYERMEDLEERLGGAFFRCHRSVIVNFEYITSYDSQNIILKDGTNLALAKPQYPGFVKAFMRYAQNGGTINV